LLPTNRLTKVGRFLYLGAMDNQSVHVVNSKELRIGNLINYPFVGIRPIRSGADIDSIFEDGGMPIPLTPEWLERCGFIIHKNGLFVNNDIWIEYKELSTPVFTPVYSDGSSFRGYIGKHITYLHQLQNLYHSLTGEELTIKETV
jgi:hypothetical protein